MAMTGKPDVCRKPIVNPRATVQGEGKSAFEAYSGPTRPPSEDSGSLDVHTPSKAEGQLTPTGPVVSSEETPLGAKGWMMLSPRSVHEAAFLQQQMMHLQAFLHSNLQPSGNVPMDSTTTPETRQEKASLPKTGLPKAPIAHKRSCGSSERVARRRLDLGQVHHSPKVDKAGTPSGKDTTTNAARSNATPGPKEAGSSSYRGVTFHKGTGRWEAHLWSGKHLYLGGFDSPQKAAEAYDKAVLAIRGSKAVTNFDPARYAAEVSELQSLDKKELVAYIRRQSSCWTRGSSKYRGVTKNGLSGSWEARLGHFTRAGCRYLGVFKTEEDAARAYDIESIKCKGSNAITNFPISDYAGLSKMQTGQLDKQVNVSDGTLVTTTET